MTTQAFTAYGRPLLHVYLGSRAEALTWAKDHGSEWPGAYIRHNGRVIWRERNERSAS